MQLSSVLAFVLLIVAVHQSDAQMTKAQQAQCKSEMEPKFNSESDKDLKDKMAKGHAMIKSTVDMVQGLTDAQKDKLRNTYFSGVCAPVKDFYNL